MRIENKKEFYKLQQAGALGNHTQQWNGYKEYMVSGFDGFVGIRFLKVAREGRYWLTRRDMVCLPWFVTGSPIVVQEMADDKKLIIQGELGYVRGILSGYLSEVR